MVVLLSLTWRRWRYICNSRMACALRQLFTLGTHLTQASPAFTLEGCSCSV